MPEPTSLDAEKKPHFIVKWLFVFGIMLLANLFVAYLVQALYPSPKYEEFCPGDLSSKMVETESMCRDMRGQWQRSFDQGGSGYCDLTVECRGKHEAALGVHDRDVFVVFVVFGVTLLIASLYLRLAEVIMLGLSFGGVLALVIGSVWHWSNMQEWLRVVVLGVAFLAVIATAAKKFKA